MVNIEKYKVKATYNNKEDIPMGLGGKGGSGGGEAGQAGKSGFPFIVVLFIVLIIAGVSYIGINF
ncbi:sporulation protein YjcZ [Bacillus wiedmannii]|nr:sporulation protein YjcZ [Bacillus wiedmannii]